MPFVKLHFRRGRSDEYRRSAADAVHEALVAKANVPAEDRFQLILEHDGESMIAHPSYGGVLRSQDLIIVEITLNIGRSVEVKKALYADIVARLGEAIAVRPDDVMITLVEVTKENWSFGGGKATYA